VRRCSERVALTGAWARMAEAAVRTRAINESECIEVNECGPRNVEQRGAEGGEKR
jgi:hypothetical protein